MTTWSPVSMWGANVGLGLPRRPRAASVHIRPRTRPSASMTCHACVISLAFGVYVLITDLLEPSRPAATIGEARRGTRKGYGPAHEIGKHQVDGVDPSCP